MKNNLWRSLGFLLTVLCALSAKADDYRVLYSFSGRPNSGYYPKGNLTVSGSSLYGMTDGGGTSNLGTIFRIGTDGSGFGLLHSFVGGANDGKQPNASLTLIGSTLYGTASGGSNSDGVCFSVGTSGSDFSLLHTFTGGSGGLYPDGNLTVGGSELYGMARGGGSSNAGILFKMGMNGSGFTPLHALAVSEGVAPYGSLVLSDSTLYGMACMGGSANQGSIFKVKTDGSGFSVIHSFTGGSSDGKIPYNSLTLVGSTLYGMTSLGGSNNDGTIFKIDTNGGDFSVIHSFAGGVNDGLSTRGDLTLVGSDLYGMSYYGGSNNLGTVFKIGLDGSDFSIVHSFLGGDDGRNPEGDLTLSGSTLYGMTGGGGTNNMGVIFSLNVPEPSTIIIWSLLGGIAVMVGWRWRRAA